MHKRTYIIICENYLNDSRNKNPENIYFAEKESLNLNDEKEKKPTKICSVNFCPPLPFPSPPHSVLPILYIDIQDDKMREIRKVESSGWEWER